MKISKDNCEDFIYKFSKDEISAFALYFRKHNDELPDELKDFAYAVEKNMYNSMSIEETIRFYS